MGMILIGQPNSSDAANMPSDDGILPETLHKLEARVDLFDQFKETYNSNSFNNCVKLIDPVARYAQEENLLKQFNFYREFMGNIREGIDSHYETGGFFKGMRIYYLCYQVLLENGEAELRISIGKQNEKLYKVIGFNIEAKHIRF